MIVSVGEMLDYFFDTISEANIFINYSQPSIFDFQKTFATRFGGGVNGCPNQQKSPVLTIDLRNGDMVLDSIHILKGVVEDLDFIGGKYYSHPDLIDLYGIHTRDNSCLGVNVSDPLLNGNDPVYESFNFSIGYLGLKR